MNVLNCLHRFALMGCCLSNISSSSFFNLQLKRHFWRIDTKTITMYQSENSTRYYKVSSGTTQNTFLKVATCTLQNKAGCRPFVNVVIYLRVFVCLVVCHTHSSEDYQKL